MISSPPHPAEDREPAVSEHTESGSQVEGEVEYTHTHCTVCVYVRTLYSIRIYSIHIQKFAIRFKLVVSAVFAYFYVHLKFCMYYNVQTHICKCPCVYGVCVYGVCVYGVCVYSVCVHII